MNQAITPCNVSSICGIFRRILFLCLYMDLMAGPGLFHDMLLPVRHEGSSTQVRNLATGRWLVLTPEEAVRQGLLAWMIRQGYPKPMISTERAIRVGRMLKRFDVVVLGRDGKPLLLAECKAPSVPLSPSVAEQAARYNTQLKAQYLLLTNGIEAQCYRFTPQGYERVLEWLPDYQTV